jgi:hypothetical protein
MSLFYDLSTALLASAQVSAILELLQARSLIMHFIFKFMVTRLFSPGIPMPTLSLVIRTISEGFKVNASEMGTIFAETQFLDRLISFCVTIRAVSATESLLKLLSDCLANETSFRPETGLFIALEPLLDGTVVDCLLRIAFNDDLGVDKPRAIRNGAPLTSLFHVYQQKDAELETFRNRETSLPRSAQSQPSAQARCPS